MKHITIKFTNREWILLEGYLLHLLQTTGYKPSKQELFKGMIEPFLQEAEATLTLNEVLQK